MVVVDEIGLLTCERIILGHMHNSSLAEVRMGLLIEPTHMEDEDDEKDDEKEDESDSGKQKRES